MEIACSLTAGSRASRLREWGRVLESALVERSETADGARLRFDAREGEELRRLVAAERECCAFLDLRLSEPGGELVLEVAAPPEARPVVEELFGR